MRTVVMGIITILLFVIVGQSVLYIDGTKDTKVTLDSLSNNINVMQAYTQEDIVKIIRRQHNMEQQVNDVQRKLNMLQTTTTTMLRNECTSYIMSREMATLCNGFGSLP